MFYLSLTYALVHYRSNESLAVYGDTEEDIINLPDPPMVEVRSSKRDMRLNSKSDLYEDENNE